MLCLYLESLPRLHVFGDLHAEDVSIYRQHHLLMQLLNLSLLALNHAFEVAQPLFVIEFKFLPSRHLFGKATLSKGKPLSHGLVMLLMILVEGRDLITLPYFNV